MLAAVAILLTTVPTGTNDDVPHVTSANDKWCC